jgi:hypothetical protein
MEYTITLTDTQVKSAETEMMDIQEWLENAIFVRADIAQKNIIEKLVAHCNENEIALEVGADAQVQQAYDLGLVMRAADVVFEEQTPEE